MCVCVCLITVLFLDRNVTLDLAFTHPRLSPLQVTSLLWYVTVKPCILFLLLFFFIGFIYVLKNWGELKEAIECGQVLNAHFHITV